MQATTARSTAEPRTRFVPDPMARFDQATREGWVFGAVAAIGLAIVAMWWQDNPSGSLHGLADQLVGLGRLTGLLGAYLLIVQVLLMARLPLLDRLIGMDRLSVWHRRNGEYSVSLLIVHAIAITWGYALSDKKGVLGETATVVLHYPDVLMATLALGLLVLIAVISVRELRRRVSYHTWYFIHLYAYLAVVLAFAHQFATGDDFSAHPLHRWFWVALHLSALAVVLVYRVALPVRSNLRHRLRVAAVVPEGPDVFSVHVTGHRLEELGAEPGQFFLWRFMTGRGWWQAHPFSLSAPPTVAGLRFTVKVAGDHTSWMQRMRPGTRVAAEGPYGALTARRRTKSQVLLVAGGIGMTPLRALFETLPAKPGHLSFVYRVSDEREIVLKDELEELARQKAARLAYVVAPRDTRPDPLRADRLRKAVPDLVHHDVYVCGSPGFTDGVVEQLHKAGVPRRQIHTEQFEF
jgi:predicted ferric reductase